MTPLRLWTAAGLLVLFGGVAAAEKPDPGYKVIKKIEIGGEGGWDYLTMDADSRRLYIARANRVQVVDVDKGKLIGEIAPTPGVHGVALDTKRKKGFISNGGDATVTVFDLESLKETARVKVGMRPDAILYDSASDRVFTFNAGTKDSTAISAADNSVAGTVALGGKPEGAVADGKGMVFVNLEDKNEVVAFDAKTLTVKNRWPVAPGTKAVGLALDRVKRRLFVTCGNEKMIILDADSGKVVGTVDIGKGTDAAGFDQEAGLAFSSNGDGTLTIVDGKGDTYKVLANVPTQAGARTMALDTKTHHVLLVTAKFKQPRVVEPDTFVILVVGK
jgi:DNA-binding beta-propeller fold protein YncE